MVYRKWTSTKCISQLVAEFLAMLQRNLNGNTYPVHVFGIKSKKKKNDLLSNWVKNSRNLKVRVYAYSAKKLNIYTNTDDYVFISIYICGNIKRT